MLQLRFDVYEELENSEELEREKQFGFVESVAQALRCVSKSTYRLF